MIAKHFGHTFTGKIIVLVDSDSASASELFARTLQLEHRGTVMGDRSSGKVMQAQYFGDALGDDTQIWFGFSVTNADLKMTDGKSLENVGVTPDELVLPSSEDLAAGRDPVLSKAAEEGGLKLTPEEAGKLFPFEWPPLK